MLHINKDTKSLAAYTFSHFSVDFACFFILFGGFKNSTENLIFVSTAFLIYNVIAFGLQPIIGYYCDSRPKIPIGLIGCVIVLLSLFLISLPWTSLLLCAFGNACFHIGGGIDSLRYANGKMTRSGIFVSSGDLGIALGAMVGQSMNAAFYIPLGLMLSSIISLLFFVKEKKEIILCRFRIASNISFSLVLILAIIAVIIRAYVGGIVPVTWKTSSFLILLPAIGAFLGKALGGFIGDKYGAKTIGVCSLALSIPFLLFGKNIALIFVIGIILFNIVMPITLCTIASKFPYYPGLAFGMTTLALLCGIMPTFFFTISSQYVILVLICLTIVSTICIFFTTKNNKGDKLYEKNV